MTNMLEEKEKVLLQREAEAIEIRQMRADVAKVPVLEEKNASLEKQLEIQRNEAKSKHEII